MTDPEFLRWIADRLERIEGASPNTDYIQRLRSLANKQSNSHDKSNLRDQFAMAALQGMLANPNRVLDTSVPHNAYAVADVMLKEREE